MLRRHRARVVVPFLLAAGLFAPSRGAAIQNVKEQRKLHIVILEGEDSVNILQQRTAVAPVVEVRDQNNQPVAGAIVRFAIQGNKATFGGANTVSATTNAAGQATVAQVTPTATGALRIDVVASSQGQTASATISQTNYATTSQAASGSKPSPGGHTGQIVTWSIVGAGAAAGAVVYEKVNAPQQPAVTTLMIQPNPAFAGLSPVEFSMNYSEYTPGRTQFTIEWGDGEVSNVSSLDTGTAGTTHVYRTTGDFRIKLTLTDTSGLHASTEGAVTVKDLTGRWVSPSGTLNLVQSGTNVAGTYLLASGSLVGAVTGRLSLSTSTGNISAINVVLTVAPGGTAAPFDFAGSAFAPQVDQFVGSFTTSTAPLTFRRQ